MTQIRFKFNGEIAKNNSISMRNLGIVCLNFQNAINRAYLDVKHGHLQKWQKMTAADFPPTEFNFAGTQESSFIIDFVQDTEIAEMISNKLESSINYAYQIINGNYEKKYFSEHERLGDIHNKLEENTIKPTPYKKAKKNSSSPISYARPAIIKYVSASLTPLRKSKGTKDTITIQIDAQKSSVFSFNKANSAKLHTLSKGKELGQVIIYNLKITKMNRSNFTGAVENIENYNSKHTIIFKSEEEFNTANQFFAKNENITILGCPMIEVEQSNSLDGDILYVDTYYK